MIHTWSLFVLYGLIKTFVNGFPAHQQNFRILRSDTQKLMVYVQGESDLTTLSNEAIITFVWVAKFVKSHEG